MPYTREWDEASPDGATTAAADIDTVFQHLKTDLRERLAQVIPGWADEDVDPKRIAVTIGTLANRPATPSNGEIYFATDESLLYIYTGTWETVAGGGSGGGGGGFTSHTNLYASTVPSTDPVVNFNLLSVTNGGALRSVRQVRWRARLGTAAWADLWNVGMGDFAAQVTPEGATLTSFRLNLARLDTFITGGSQIVRAWFKILGDGAEAGTAFEIDTVTELWI